MSTAAAVRCFGVSAAIELFRARTIPFPLPHRGVRHHLLPVRVVQVSPAEAALAVKTSYQRWTFLPRRRAGLNPGYSVPMGGSASA